VWTGAPLVTDLVTTSREILADIVRRIVEKEGPLHEADLIARVCDVWGTKAGARIQAAIREAVVLADRNQFIVRRGPFAWTVDGRCQVRSRVGTGISGDRIPPEEIAHGIRLVLSSGVAFERPPLITEVRGLFGYNRTGPILEAAIGSVLDGLVADGVVGEGSRGLLLRPAAV
jgi:hypothetical protein